MKTIWTREALLQLAAIEEFIARENPQRAKIFTDYLIEQGERIEQNPMIGRTVPELANPAIREIIVKKYRIVYKINNNEIIILTLFEGHQLLSTEKLDMSE